jgi:hypothetical protein
VSQREAHSSLFAFTLVSRFLLMRARFSHTANFSHSSVPRILSQLASLLSPVFFYRHVPHQVSFFISHVIYTSSVQSNPLFAVLAGVPYSFHCLGSLPVYSLHLRLRIGSGNAVYASGENIPSYALHLTDRFASCFRGGLWVIISWMVSPTLNIFLPWFR